MRNFIMAFALAATVAPFAAVTPPAMAQDRRDWREERREDRREWREDRREARREWREDRREARRDWREARRYDWNRPDPRYRNYDPARYYRDGRYYRERRLSRGDRIYRGYDGRYYCRRPDGTTGLIIGAVAGGLLGNALDNGRSSTLGTLLGAGGGALLGRAIERDGLRCR